MAERDITVALARAVAGREVDIKAVDSLADRLGSFEYKVRGINPCIYGICLDFFIEGPRIDDLLTKALDLGGVRQLKVFPWGIPWPDLFHVQVEQQFDGIPDSGMTIGH
jgi:hypothetical protein